MDSIQQIAVSRISDILTNGSLIFPESEGIKRIFYNAGQSELYEAEVHRLKERVKEENWEKVYYNNERSYSALLYIFTELMEDLNQFIKLLNGFIEKIPIYKVFQEDIEKKANLRKPYSSYFDISDYLNYKSVVEAQSLLKKYSSKEFEKLKSNLNILTLDINFNQDLELKITMFSLNEARETETRSLMVEWLKTNYPNIQESYESAVRMFGEANAVECLSDCRNVITGIFSYQKEEGTKWYKGLQKACIADKNIEKVQSPISIPSWKNGLANDRDPNKRYNYPRFKTICQIYSFLSDLGSHKDEANIINGIIDYERPTFEDAHLGLRLTESILVWIYQNQLANL